LSGSVQFPTNVDTYLTACNSHDGSMAFRLMVTPVRVVCASTLAAAIRRAKASFSIHHTTGARSQIQAVREALGLTFRYMGEFQTEAERMLDTTMTGAQFAALVRELWPMSDEPTLPLDQAQAVLLHEFGHLEDPGARRQLIIS
jgi:hypothetical protein